MSLKLIPLLLSIGGVCLGWQSSPAIAPPLDCGDGIPVGRVERPNVSGMLPVDVVREEYGSRVNVRAAPGLASEIVAQVSVGDRLFVSTRQYAPDFGVAVPGAACELWYFVQDAGPLGWVRGDLIAGVTVEWRIQR